MDEVSRLGTIMGLWAHPDDETFMSGGLMAMAVRNGQDVIVVTATRGEAGVQDPLRWPQADMAGIRALELGEALRRFGVKHHEWLHYRDGACKDIKDEDAVTAVMPLLEKYKPDTIITFPPDGLTGHEDHMAVSRWAGAAAARSKKPAGILQAVTTEEAYRQYFREIDEKFDLYFKIDKPRFIPQNNCGLVLDLPEEFRRKKVEALKGMPSQYYRWFQEYSFDYLCQAFGTESFIKV
jgi:LmbE family N-acetylglucosaminyl deacetylase